MHISDRFVCDFCVVIFLSQGILVRSSSWINFQLPMEDLQSASHNATVKSSHLYCAVSSVS